MQKLNSLTGIRSIAALGVVMVHYKRLVDFSIFVPLVKKGYLGVDLFFILSGFIICHVYLKNFTTFHSPSVLRFLLLRVARIFPVHYFMLLVYVLYLGITSLMMKDSGIFYSTGNLIDLVLNFLNMQAWGIARHTSWNKAAWSVSAEWLAYLLFPFFAPLLQKVKGLYQNIGIIMLCLGGLLLYATWHHLPQMNWTAKHGVARVVPEFIIGCCLYTLYSSIQHSSKWLVPVSIVTFILGAYLGVPDVLLILLFIPLLFGLAKGGDFISHILSSKFMIYGGEISYSLYVVHWFIKERVEQYVALTHLFSPAVPKFNIFYFAGILLLTWGAAHFTFKYIEVPSRNYIRLLLDNVCPFDLKNSNASTGRALKKCLLDSGVSGDNPHLSLE